MATAAKVSAKRVPATNADAAPGWFLVGNLGDKEGLSQVPIGKVPFAIGRHTANDLQIPSRSVSKSHAQIIVAVDAVIVQDLGSTNGTFVNGKRISAPTLVGEGDLLQFAEVELRLGRATTGTGDHTAVANCPESGWLISRLHEVINERRFRMYFQPIVTASDLRTTAVEALVRCPIEGLELPARLFEAACRLGLEERLSSVCRVQAVQSLAGQPSNRQLFLNTHPHEYLGPELVRSLRQLREEAATRPMVLEVHEAAVPSVAALREFRDALRDLGIGLAYDDFGAGQSRLLELSKAPPDFLKFDRSLLEDTAMSSANHRALLRTLLRHAADLGIATVAEGLDSQESVDTCREMGFTHFQGYHFCRPVPADELPVD